MIGRYSYPEQPKLLKLSRIGGRKGCSSFRLRLVCNKASVGQSESGLTLYRAEDPDESPFGVPLFVRDSTPLMNCPCLRRKLDVGVPR